MTFRARELREGTTPDEIRRELNAIQKEIAADLLALRSQAPVTPLVTDSTYSANYGQIVRAAPPSGGLRLILPPINIAVPNGRVVAVVEAATGALSVEAIDSTINGSTTLTYLAGIGTVEFLLTPTGWYAWSSSLITVALTSLASQAADTFVGNVTAGAAAPTAVGLSTLAGAGLTFGSHTLAVGAGDGIDVNADDVAVDVTDIVDNVSITEVATNNIQRAALTGEATAAAGLNAVTVTRSTDYNTAPWTGNHKFSGELRLGTLHTESAAVGAINITLTAGASRILLLSTGAVTIGTISGAADGRVCVFEHVRSSGVGDVTFTHAVTANGVACPGSVNLTLTGNRSGCVLVCRDDVWRVHAHTN